MKIDKVLEALNDTLRTKDMTIWMQEEEIKRLKAELEQLKEKNK